MEEQSGVSLEKIGCMVLMSNGRCGRPVQYIYHGAAGPFYRCGKHGRIFLNNRRNDATVVERDLDEDISM